MPKVDIAIVGMMKAGTTTVHQILNNCENVYIPKAEVHYFDQQDLRIHPDFCLNFFGKKFVVDLPLLGWLGSVPSNKRIAIDATTLIYSRAALKKMLQANPEIKIIVCMRNLVERFESHYWHLVQKGRLPGVCFEEEIQDKPELFERSFVSENLKFLLTNSKNIYLMALDELREKPEQVLADLSTFLSEELSFGSNSHANRGKYPRVKALRRGYIGIFGGLCRFAYAHRIFPCWKGRLALLIFRSYQVGLWLVSFGYTSVKPRVSEAVCRAVSEVLRIEQEKQSKLLHNQKGIQEDLI